MGPVDDQTKEGTRHSFQEGAVTALLMSLSETIELSTYELSGVIAKPKISEEPCKYQPAIIL